MKKTILVIVATLGIFIFTGCLAIVGTAVLSTIQSHPVEGRVNKEYLNDVMRHSANHLLTESEKIRAGKNICALKHLNVTKNHSVLKNEAKAFCNLNKKDKIYFHYLCKECDGIVDTTGYVLVRDGEPFRFVQIENKRNKKLNKTVPIVDRLH